MSSHETESLKIAVLDGVCEHNEGYPVELWLEKNTFVLRAYNECGNNYVSIDFTSLIEWMRCNSKETFTYGRNSFIAGKHSK
jgi:hypothetical protein